MHFGHATERKPTPSLPTSRHHNTHHGRPPHSPSPHPAPPHHHEPYGHHTSHPHPHPQLHSSTPHVKHEHDGNTSSSGLPHHPPPPTTQPYHTGHPDQHHSSAASSRSSSSTTSSSSIPSSSAMLFNSGATALKDHIHKAHELQPTSDVAEWAHQMHLRQHRSYWWCSQCFPKSVAQPLDIPKSMERRKGRHHGHEPAHAYE